MEKDVWRSLRKYTPARIAIGRAGGSLPTGEVLDFAWAHAEARDAVKMELDVEKLAGAIEELGVKCHRLESAAGDRESYVRRPDLGRRLSDESRRVLEGLNPPTASCDVAIIVADGLSAMAAQGQAVRVLEGLLPMLASSKIGVGPVCVVRNGRVAIEDEIGEMLGAKAAVILLGERPGLGTADSLGAYLVFGPKVGRTDAERNCVSNIREAGMRAEVAAETIGYLLGEALRRRISGVGLKDERVRRIDQSVDAKLAQ
ncbi:MAG TPA: ethanolamine ammonia-lyase subunit EutC [Tepidisphaeraceae bacterium]|jgi:ethanolamine ammonia-lyase small subunit|nr:ethanolamine ammonia-lyase subunit EutC [Tepidisphaeraceae bacterium]